MSRSYHVTRKQADQAMSAGDLTPTWLASEKRWVKEKEAEKRVLAKGLPHRAKVPNRAVVSKEKARTARAQPSDDIQRLVDEFIVKSEEAEKRVRLPISHKHKR